MEEGEPGAIPAVKHVDLPVKLPTPRKPTVEEEKKVPDLSSRPTSPRPFDETIKVNQLKELDDIMAQLRDTGPSKKSPETNIPKVQSTPTTLPSGRITPLSAPPERLDMQKDSEDRNAPSSAPGSASHPPVSEIPIRKPFQGSGRPPLGVEQRMYVYPQVSDVTSDTGDLIPNNLGPMLVQNPVAFVDSPTPKMVNTYSGALPHQQSYPLETPGVAPLDISPTNSTDPEINDHWTATDYNSDEGPDVVSYHKAVDQESLNPKEKEVDSSTVDISQDCSTMNVCLADAAKMAEAFYNGVGESMTNEKMLPEEPQNPPDDTPPATPDTSGPIKEKPEDAEQVAKGGAEEEVGKDTKNATEDPKQSQSTPSASPLSSSEPPENSPPSKETSNVPSPVSLLAEVEVSRENAVPTVTYTEVDPMTLEQGLPTRDYNENAPTNPDHHEGSICSKGSYTISSVDYTMQGSISGDSTNTSSPPVGKSGARSLATIVDDVPSDPLSDAILKGASVGAALLGLDTEPKPQVLNTVDFEDVKKNEGNLENLNVTRDTQDNLSVCTDEYDEEQPPASNESKTQQRSAPSPSPVSTSKPKSKHKRYLLLFSILLLLIGIIAVILGVTTSSSKPSNSSSIVGNFGSGGGPPSQSPSLSSDVSLPVASPTVAPYTIWAPVSSPDVPEPVVPETPTSSPNRAPSTDGPIASRETLFGNLLKSSTYTDVEYGPETPEGRALMWMVNQDTSVDPADTSAENQMHIAQRYALMTIWFNSFDSDWREETNWRSEDECSWYGVVCAENSSVIRIDMVGNGLTGSISPELALITSLETLVLNENNLEGTLPKSLTDLKSLRVLGVRDNSLSGELKDFDISQMESLRVFDLNSNGFAGEIPPKFFASSQLTYFDLGNNMITGPLSKDISQMESLRYLNFTNNDMTGSLPEQFSDLSSIEIFDISENEFVGSIPVDVGDLDSLKTFIVRDNQLDGNIPTTFGLLNALETLSLERNSFTGRIPDTLSSLSNLENLFLGGNNYESNVFPTYVYDFKNLKTLHLEDTMLSGSIATDIANLEELVSLRLDNNNLNETIPEEVGLLENLEELRLDGNSFIGTIPSEFGNLVKVTDLSLNFNELSGPLPGTFGNLSDLQRLTVGGNYLSGSLPDSLTNLVKLQFFSCEDAFFEGPIPEDIGDMEALEVFRCHLNRWEGESRGLTGSIPDSIGNLENLRTFLVYQNSLDGTIPRELGNIETLEIIDLELNRFGGAVPETLGNLDDLRIIRLGGNANLQDLPASLCELDSLEIYRAGCSQNCTCCTQRCGSRPTMTL